MSKILPVGVRVARLVNLFQAALSFVLLAVTLVVGALTIRRGGIPPKDIVIIALALWVLVLVIFLFSVWLIIGLGKLNPLARKMQILVSIICLLSFPVGTVLHGIVLYYMFTKETKQAFIVNQ